MATHTEDQQKAIAEQFELADAISRLEGYNPDSFEEAQKLRIIQGEISTDEFIEIIVQHYGQDAA